MTVRPARRTVLVAGTVSLLAAACEDDRGASGRTSRTSPPPDVHGWTALPAAPVQDPVLRRGPAVVWTGRRVLVQGGSSPFPDGCAVAVTGDGAAWTPGPGGRGGGRWSLLPPAPVAPRSGAWLWWTGTAAVLVGGVDPWAQCESRPGGALDVAALTPGAEAGGTWERLPDLPWPAGTPVAASAWAGGGAPGAGQVLVWSPAAGAWSLTLGPAGPASWSRLPDPPVPAGTATAAPWTQSLHSAWTGREWLVAGVAGGRDVVGVAFDPAGPSWRAVDPGPLARYGVSATWAGTRWAAFDPQAGLSWFDPASGRWAAAPAGPLDGLGGPSGEPPVLVWTGREVVVWGGARAARDGGTCVDGDGVADSALEPGGPCDPATGPLGAALDPAAGTWRLIADGPWQRRTGTVGVWAGDRVFLAGGIDLEQRRGGGLPRRDHPARAFATFDPGA